MRFTELRERIDFDFAVLKGVVSWGGSSEAENGNHFSNKEGILCPLQATIMDKIFERL